MLNQWISSQPLMPVVLARINDLAQHPEINLSSPTILNVNVLGNYITAEVSGADSVYLMLTLSEYNSRFQKIIMIDDGQNGDLFANDGIYTSYYQFPVNGDKVKFYIRAINSNALTLSPERAEYEFYTYSTITGNTNLNDIVQKRLLKVIDISSKNRRAKSCLLYTSPSPRD